MEEAVTINLHLTQLLFYTMIIAVAVNYLRYKVSAIINKVILIVSSLLVVALYGLYEGTHYIGVLLLLVISMASFTFQVLGGILLALVTWGILIMETHQPNGFFLITYLLVGICMGVFVHLMEKKKKEHEDWNKRLIKNSKQLNVFREVSTSMQKTHELDKILHIILTSVTAGYGLGFNRAMILLVNEENNKLQGMMGVGPMSPEEGFKIWERITKQRYRLLDLIEIQGEEDAIDPQLNERVRELIVDLTDENFLYKVLKKGEPLHIKHISKKDEVQQRLATQFGMEAFVVFPLINQGVNVGVLMIDNPVNKKEITQDDIDSVIPLANQAAITIQQAHLYSQIEDMALKDGLTGLLNQRAFQSTLQKYTSHEREQPLSLILLDIDYFKHYNDTNGHLLGNEVLIQLASIIQKSTRVSDDSFRFGGEEFVILLPNTMLDEAYSMAEEIRQKVESNRFPNGEMQPAGRLSISLGVASSTQLHRKSGRDLIDIADKALYEAKAFGKNKVVAYKEFVSHE